MVLLDRRQLLEDAPPFGVAFSGGEQAVDLDTVDLVVKVRLPALDLLAVNLILRCAFSCHFGSRSRIVAWLLAPGCRLLPPHTWLNAPPSIHTTCPLT